MNQGRLSRVDGRWVAFVAVLAMVFACVCVPASASAETYNGETYYEGTSYPVYRLYNQWSGEHLFSTDATEYYRLCSIGWTGEGVGWWSKTISSSRSGMSSEPVYRLYNPYSGDHHYTKSKEEYDHLGAIGWSQEGQSFDSLPTSYERSGPAYRLFNKWLTQGTHFFTTSRPEFDYLGSIGWNQEGVAFYGIPSTVAAGSMGGVSLSVNAEDGSDLTDTGAASVVIEGLVSANGSPSDAPNAVDAGSTADRFYGSVKGTVEPGVYHITDADDGSAPGLYFLRFDGGRYTGFEVYINGKKAERDADGGWLLPVEAGKMTKVSVVMVP